MNGRGSLHFSAGNGKREHEVRFPDKFWRSGTCLSLAAKGMYAILATFADYRTGETWVGNPRLERESGLGRDKVKALLRELESAGFISRRRYIRKNLRAERYIRCLKYVSPTNVKSANRPDGLVFGTHENAPNILTPVKSSVTPEEKQKSSLPNASGQIPERIM